MNPMQLRTNCIGNIFIKVIFILALWLSIHFEVQAQDFWRRTGIPGTGHVYALAANSKNDIFAGTIGSGIFRSGNDGSDWTAINSGLILNFTNVRAIAVGQGDHIFAGLTTDLCQGSGIFRSNDNGENWALLTTSLPDLCVVTLLIDSLGYIIAGTERGIIRSTDGGANWATVDTDFFTGAIKANPFSNDLFAGTKFFGLLRSTDRGETWEKIGNESWHRQIESFAFNTHEYIFAGTFGSGIYRSRNHGENWNAVNNGLLDTDVAALVVDRSGRIWAGTYNRGVFYSRDDGENWFGINSGLEHHQVRCLLIDVNDHIYVGTEGGGIFRSIEPTTSVQETIDSLHILHSLQQNHPNPFNPETKIVFFVPPNAQQQRVVIKIFDLTGRLVRVLFDREVAPGHYEVMWDGRDAHNNELASGTYVYRLESDKNVITQKMLLIH